MFPRCPLDECRHTWPECATDDLVALLGQKAAQLNWEVEESVLCPIAQRAMGTPRLALRLLQSARRTTRAAGDTVITVAHTGRTFQIEELDSLGLGSDERAYLSVLAESPDAVRLHVIASRLGHPHALRHTMATEYLAATGNDLVGLAQLLGHESIQTTSRYTQRRIDQLAEAAGRMEY